MKNKFNLLFALLPGVFLLGCGTTDPQKKDDDPVLEGDNIITFKMGDGIMDEKAIAIEHDEEIILPNPPIKEGNTFIGWFYDEALTKPYDKNQKIEKDFNLYAKYEEYQEEEISTVDQFLNMNLDGHYKLTANIDFQDAEINPIGTYDNPFSGTFNGNGFTIKNYTPKLGTYTGLFGYVTGSILNTKVSCAWSFEYSETIYLSPLVSVLYGGVVNNCSSSGVVVVNACGTEYSCLVGGVVAKNESGFVQNCYSTASVSCLNDGVNYIGGVVGYNGSGEEYSSRVAYCYYRKGTLTSSVNVDRASSYVGGVCAFNFGLIDKCFSYDCELTSKTSDYNAYCGGVLADNDGGIIKNCFSAASCKASTESGNTYRGYVMARNFRSTTSLQGGTYQNCYGFVGQKMEYSISAEYADIAANLIFNVPLASLEQAGSEDFYKKTLRFTNPNLKFKEGKFPSLLNDFSSVQMDGYEEGSAANPILINNADQLSSIAMNKSYKLTADIDLSGKAIKPIGSAIAPYYGVFDGDGHTIKGINITAQHSSTFDALFGNLNGSIINLKVESNVSFDSTNKACQYVAGLASMAIRSYVGNCETKVNLNTISTGMIMGGLVGYSEDSFINKSSTTGSLEGYSKNLTNYLGGLVGINRDGKIELSHTNVNVKVGGSTDTYGGGLIGKNMGYATNCYAKGNLEVKESQGDAYIGGLIGMNYEGKIKKAFADTNISYAEKVKRVYCGGFTGVNQGTIVKCFYNVNPEVMYSSGASKVLMGVERIQNNNWKDAIKVLGSAFVLENNIPVLAIEKGGK